MFNSLASSVRFTEYGLHVKTHHRNVTYENNYFMYRRPEKHPGTWTWCLVQHTVKNHGRSEPATYNATFAPSTHNLPTFPLVLLKHSEPIIRTCNTISVRTVSRCMRHILNIITFINDFAADALSWRTQLCTQCLKGLINGTSEKIVLRNELTTP